MRFEPMGSCRSNPKFGSRGRDERFYEPDSSRIILASLGGDVPSFLPIVLLLNDILLPND